MLRSFGAQLKTVTAGFLPGAEQIQDRFPRCSLFFTSWLRRWITDKKYFSNCLNFVPAPVIQAALPPV
jgi:hypothetical protein